APILPPPSTERVVVRPPSDPDESAELVTDDMLEWDLPDEETSPLAVGSRFGPYEILGELARGAMGVLYRARHSKLEGRVVALKVLQGKLADDQEHVLRFRREAEALARLDHPNVVRVHDAGELEGRRFFTMELVEGETLEDKIARGPLDQRDAARVLATVARGVSHLHARGVLHRDLKLANVLVGKDGRARIADFGLARLVDDRRTRLTLDGDLLGTPLYMAPEQVRGELDLDSRVDVYGLGVMLFRLVTKKYPFPAGSAAQLHARILTESPHWPPEIAVAADMKKIIECALAKERDDRYSTAAALAQDLESFAEGKPVRARVPPRRTPEKTPTWFRRFLAALGLSAVVLVVAGAVKVELTLARRSAADRVARAAERARAARTRLEEDGPALSRAPEAREAGNDSGRALLLADEASRGKKAIEDARAERAAILDEARACTSAPPASFGELDRAVSALGLEIARADGHVGRLLAGVLEEEPWNGGAALAAARALAAVELPSPDALAACSFEEKLAWEDERAELERARAQVALLAGEVATARAAEERALRGGGRAPLDERGRTAKARSRAPGARGHRGDRPRRLGPGLRQRARAALLSRLRRQRPRRAPPDALGARRARGGAAAALGRPAGRERGVARRVALPSEEARAHRAQRGHEHARLRRPGLARPRVRSRGERRIGLRERARSRARGARAPAGAGRPARRARPRADSLPRPAGGRSGRHGLPPRGRDARPRPRPRRARGRGEGAPRGGRRRRGRDERRRAAPPGNRPPGARARTEALGRLRPRGLGRGRGAPRDRARAGERRSRPVRARGRARLARPHASRASRRVRGRAVDPRARGSARARDHGRRPEEPGRSRARGLDPPAAREGERSPEALAALARAEIGSRGAAVSLVLARRAIGLAPPLGSPEGSSSSAAREAVLARGLALAASAGAGAEELDEARADIARVADSLAKSPMRPLERDDATISLHRLAARAFLRARADRLALLELGAACELAEAERLAPSVRAELEEELARAARERKDGETAERAEGLALIAEKQAEECRLLADGIRGTVVKIESSEGGVKLDHVPGDVRSQLARGLELTRAEPRFCFVAAQLEIWIRREGLIRSLSYGSVASELDPELCYLGIGDERDLKFFDPARFPEIARSEEDPPPDDAPLAALPAGDHDLRTACAFAIGCEFKIKAVSPRDGISYARRFLARRPAARVGHVVLGRLLTLAGDAHEAADELELARDLAPPFSERAGRERASLVHYFLAEAELACGRGADAKEALQHAVRLGFRFAHRIDRFFPGAVTEKEREELKKAARRPR
ncbi:serine/threonine protein kinase, partial [bacterium]|nr:serine/threonine protein kinase [bacterium]